MIEKEILLDKQHLYLNLGLNMDLSGGRVMGPIRLTRDEPLQFQAILDCKGSFVFCLLPGFFIFKP